VSIGPDAIIWTDVDPDAADVEIFVPLVLKRVVPSVGAIEGGERISIFGNGLTQGAKVRFGDTLGNGVLVVDPGQVNVNVPAHAAGLVDISVELLDGQSDTLGKAYLYSQPFTFTAITPDVGAMRGGTTVELSGTELQSDMTVFIGNRQLEDMVLVDRHTIRGVVPARLNETPGRVDVVVTNGFEQRVLPRSFQYLENLDVR